jgi:integrase
MTDAPRKRRRQGRRTFGATRQLPSGRWQASYLAPDGARRIAPQTFAEAADANAWLASIESSISQGDWRPPELSRETFAAYGERWLEHRTDLRPRTRELYDGLWRRWLKPSFPHATLGGMTPETWRAWYLKTTTEHPGSTQPAKAYRLARAILNTAVDDGLIRSNPCRVKGAGKENSPERPIAMPDQVAAIAENITPRYRLMVMLAAYCSLRFGELAGLRRARVNLLHRTITIEEQAVELADGSTIFGPPKSAAGRRVVAFPAEIVPMIEVHLAEHVGASKDALLFTSREGLPLRRTKFRPHWSAACRVVGVTGLHFHDLRGSGATWAATAGATVRELMSRLGHSTPAVALRYQHATLERDRAIADRLGVLLSATEPTGTQKGA